MDKKTSGVYKITNTITGDFYIGSSRNIKPRWATHKCPSTWKKCPNNPLYLDMQKYGLDNFTFEIIEETDNLHVREQYFIDLLKPSYNSNRANGRDIERCKKWKEDHRKDDLDSHRKCNSKLCLYEGETLTLNALSQRFYNQGIPHAWLKAKDYLL